MLGVRGQFGVEVAHQLRGRRIIHKPQCREGRACPRFHRHSGQPERGAIVARRGLAGAEGEQFDRLVAELRRADVNTVLVLGSAGVGKTTLTQQLLTSEYLANADNYPGRLFLLTSLKPKIISSKYYCLYKCISLKR